VAGGWWLVAGGWWRSSFALRGSGVTMVTGGWPMNVLTWVKFDLRAV